MNGGKTWLIDPSPAEWLVHSPTWGYGNMDTEGEAVSCGCRVVMALWGREWALVAWMAQACELGAEWMQWIQSHTAPADVCRYVNDSLGYGGTE